MIDTELVAAIKLLKANMSGLSAGSKGYASLLMSKEASRGIFTHNERTWLLQAASEAYSPVLSPSFKPKSKRTGPYAELMDRFDQAAQYTKFPRLRLLSGEYPLQLSRTGAGSPQPRTVSITNAGAFGNSKFYGRINLNGVIALSIKSDTGVSVALNDILKILQLDFGLSIYTVGQQQNACPMCSRALKAEASKRHGYHKLCSQRWGLAWHG